jgi:hypothetical protein
LPVIYHIVHTPKDNINFDQWALGLSVDVRIDTAVITEINMLILPLKETILPLL